MDWDVHHGNGIQKMFLDDPKVLYISIHCLEKFPFDFENADSKVIGTGPGKGFNVNISWPTVQLKLINYNSKMWFSKIFYLNTDRNGRFRLSSR